MTRWLLALFTAAIGCQTESDPLYGTRPVPAAVRRTASAPRPQVMVAPTVPQLPHDAPRADAGGPRDALQETPSEPPPSTDDPPSPGDEGIEGEVATDLTPTEQERQLDELAYEDDYLRQKERLLPEQLGRWIAIVRGRLLPADERGRLQAAETFDAALAAADAAAPDALHRFLFRIGEEGDVVYADASSQPRNVIGTAFKARFGITAAFDAKSQALRWERGERSHEFELDRGRMALLLGDPANRQSLSVRIDDSAGFGGFLAIEPTFAALAEAPRYEIPGRVLLKTPSGIELLRRARVRVKVRELDLDEMVPAAVWPE